MERTSRSLLDRILYKYIYVGQDERDGVIHKKYKKVRRFPALRKIKAAASYILLAIMLLALAYALIGLMNLPPSHR